MSKPLTQPELDERTKLYIDALNEAADLRAALLCAGEQLAMWNTTSDRRSWTCVDWADYYRQKAADKGDAFVCGVLLRARQIMCEREPCGQNEADHD